MINYNGLFEILERRTMRKTDLLEIISSGTLAKLNKNQNLQTEIIDKICNYLSVQPGEIMEYYKITNISLIPKEHILYEAGYRQEIIIEYPEANDEFQEKTNRLESLISKRAFDNIDEIMNGKIKIPNTFIPEYEAFRKDPYLKNKLKELNKFSST